MSKLIIRTDNTDSKRKAFNALMVALKDKDQVKNLLGITTQEVNEWSNTLEKEVNLIQDWGLGKWMERGKQCRFNNKVFNIVQGHQVNDINNTPEVAIALYRPTPVAAPGRLYPLWNSIGLIDATNFWRVGDRVDFNNEYWQCTQGDGAGQNYWQPGVFGWVKIVI